MMRSLCILVWILSMVGTGCSSLPSSPSDPIGSGSGSGSVESCLSPCLLPLQHDDQQRCLVVTQGYGVGTHVPADVFGAIDLAVDGDRDGTADPSATWDVPVRASHDGIVTMVAYQPSLAGHHVRVANELFMTAYSHLNQITVSVGQRVTVGAVIGTVGSTGASTGPHLDYQVWVWNGRSWVNRDPFLFHPSHTFCPS